MPAIYRPICATIFLSFLLSLFVCGCDPIGLRRVQLQLSAPVPGDNTNSTLSVDSPDVEEALGILDKVAIQHGLHRTNNEPGYIRVYRINGPPETHNGDVYTWTLPCRVKLTSAGLLVTFGNPGFLGGQVGAEDLFVDVRTTFIKRYGKKHVRSHKFSASDF